MDEFFFLIKNFKDSTLEVQMLLPSLRITHVTSWLTIPCHAFSSQKQRWNQIKPTNKPQKQKHHQQFPNNWKVTTLLLYLKEEEYKYKVL